MNLFKVEFPGLEIEADITMDNYGRTCPVCVCDAELKLILFHFPAGDGKDGTKDCRVMWAERYHKL